MLAHESSNAGQLQGDAVKGVVCHDCAPFAGVVRGFLYFSMFPIFIGGSFCFYFATHLRVLFVPRSKREVTARYFIHRGAQLLFKILRWFSLVDSSVRLAAERVNARRAGVIVANHPSMLDAMLLLSEFPNAVCIMKRSLLRLPLIAGFARMAGYIPQADAPELLESARGIVSSGASIIIFPEGTRSLNSSVGEFRRGAARIAVETGSPVHLFAVTMEPVVLGRSMPWWRPPRALVRYRCVQIPTNEGLGEGAKSLNPEGVRAETVRLTRSLEDCVRNSLSLGPKTSTPGAL